MTSAINFINIGERTNVTGSARFKRLIKEEDYDTALSVAREREQRRLLLERTKVTHQLGDPSRARGIADKHTVEASAARQVDACVTDPDSHLNARELLQRDLNEVTR